jgi:hypothetical protein
VRAGFTGEVGRAGTGEGGPASASPHANRFVLLWHVDEDELSVLHRLDSDLLPPEGLDRVAGHELVGAAQPRCPTDEVEVAGPALAEVVLCSDAWIERSDEDRRV